ncbi:MAG: hypothetical protein ACE5KA_05030 [Nitrososphaerales archaeon]
MDRTVKFFIFGVIIGLIIPFLERAGEIDELMENPERFLRKFASTSASIWLFIHFSVALVILPFAAIEPLRNKVKVKHFLPIPFVMGTSFGLISVSLVAMVSEMLR